jgi:hypothetical protein
MQKISKGADMNNAKIVVVTAYLLACFVQGFLWGMLAPSLGIAMAGSLGTWALLTLLKASIDERLDKGGSGTGLTGDDNV